MEQPIFIVGTMRSGTTLLRLVLDSHENIAIGPETGFSRTVPFVKHLPPWTSVNGWYRSLGITDEEMNTHIAGFYTGLFRQHAEAQGKSRWGDKTPSNLEHMGTLAELFPGATFVAIVRHPGAVMASLKRRGRTFAEGLQMWVDRNGELVAGGEALNERFFLLRYEDLVQNPQPLLAQLLAIVGEPWSDSVLQHHRVQSDRGAPKITDGGTRTGDPLDPTRADHWIGDLSLKQRGQLIDRTGGLMQLFGYTEDGVREADIAQLVVNGAALRQRREKLGIHLMPPTRRTLRTPAARRRAQVRHALRLMVSDPSDTLRRLGAGAREMALDRGRRPVVDPRFHQHAAALLSRDSAINRDEG